MNDNDKPISKLPVTSDSDPCDHPDCDHHGHPAEHKGTESSRRKFLKTGMTGLAAGTIVGTGLAGDALAGLGHGNNHHHWLAKLFGFGKGHGKHHGPPPRHGKGKGRRHRTLLKGGTVLTMDPGIGDFVKADVLIEDSRIVAIKPNIHAWAEVVDCRGMIVMPGFVNTHHHQYQAMARGILADGIHIRGSSWPLRTYTSVVQGHWTSGSESTDSGEVVLELGRSPYRPDDNYLCELVASLSQINAGVTTGIDTSQSSHSPEHTDAMIEGLMDSGRRTLYAYSSGRSDTPGYEYPGSIDDPSTGIGRLRNQHFSSDDQLVTLGLGGGLSANSLMLARHYGAPLISHSFGDANAAAIAENEAILGDDQTYIHTTRFSDETYARIANSGGHVSLAVPIEMSMQHGMPPIQQARNHGILPSLSADVETNMSADMFTIMRATFTLQRALLNERILGGETELTGDLLTCDEVLGMATIAGARAAQVGDKAGSLTPGKEADIIVLDATRINTMPLNNAPGTVVTMMDTSNVKHVFIGGEVKKWNFELVDVNEDKLRHEIENARDRVLAELLAGNPDYDAPFIGSCCIGSYQDVGG